MVSCFVKWINRDAERIRLFLQPLSAPILWRGNCPRVRFIRVLFIILYRIADSETPTFVGCRSIRKYRKSLRALCLICPQLRRFCAHDSCTWSKESRPAEGLAGKEGPLIAKKLAFVFPYRRRFMFHASRHGYCKLTTDDPLLCTPAKH